MATLHDIAKDFFSLTRLHDNGVPTASLAILKDGKLDCHVLTSGGENQDTVYQAASISKAICALAVAKLVDDGKLSYDTKVADHLDAKLIDIIVGSDEKTKALMERITVSMLLSHTAGLSQHGFPGYEGEKVATPQEIVAGNPPANTPRIRFDAFPGSQCSYSGGGYVLLQLMLEKITGTDFAELIQQTLFRPLRMNRSWYGDLPTSETNYACAHWTASARTQVKRGYHIQPELAAAGLWTTPANLLKAISAIQDSLYTTTGFLQQETAKLMLARASPLLRSGAIGIPGLGWWINDIGFAHGGDNLPGYNTYVMGFYGTQQPRNGIAIMTNSALGHETCVKQIIGAIMYAQGWSGSFKEDDIWMPSARDGFVPYPAPASAAIDEGWRRWKGKWTDGWEIIETEDGKSAIKFGDFAAMPLKSAAVPVKSFADGKNEIWLVVDGLKIGVRLTYADDGAGEEVVRLQMEDGTVLKRAS